MATREKADAGNRGAAGEKQMNPTFGTPLMGAGYEEENAGPGPLHERGENLRFTAARRCQLFGKRFAAGDTILVLLDQDWDENEGLYGGGPWDGATAATLKRIASHIAH